MSNGDELQETPPVSGHTVIDPEHIGLPPRVRNAPGFTPPEKGHTVIESEERDLDEPTDTAKKIRQKTST